MPEIENEKHTIPLEKEAEKILKEYKEDPYVIYFQISYISWVVLIALISIYIFFFLDNRLRSIFIVFMSYNSCFMDFVFFFILSYF